MPKESIQSRSITPSINYAIKVTVFEQEKQLWKKMNWELHKLRAETIFEEGKKIMLWPWVYIVEENSNKIYVKKHLEEVCKRITHKQYPTTQIWLVAQYADCKINHITALNHFNPKIQNKNK